MQTPIRLPGRFNDGRRATRVEVVVEAAPDGDAAEIRTTDGASVAAWPRADVRLVEPAVPGAALRLRCGDDDARLTLPATTDRDALGRLFPDMARRDGHRHGLRIAVLAVAAVAALAIVVTLLLPQIATGLARLVPAPVADRLGGETAAQLARLLGPNRQATQPFCDAAGGRAALDDLTERLTASVALPYPIDVQVVASPINNAVALPGGHILVFEGLLRRVPDAAGFAGVLAHEIGHVAARDPMTAAIKGAGTALLVGIVVGDLTGGGVVGAVGQAAIGATYHRDAEAAADATAVRLLNQAGIRGDGLADFLDAVAKQEPSGSVAFSIFSTHPASTARAAAVRRATTGAGPGLTPAAWRALKDVCRSG